MPTTTTTTTATVRFLNLKVSSRPSKEFVQMAALVAVSLVLYKSKNSTNSTVVMFKPDCYITAVHK